MASLSNGKSHPEEHPARTLIQRDFERWKRATHDPSELVLGIAGYGYADLFDADKLAELMRLFEADLAEHDPAASEKLRAYRADAALGPLEVSAAILAVAPHVSDFVARLFKVEGAQRAQKADVDERQPLWAFKREFVKKRVHKPSAGQSFTAVTVGLDDGARGALARAIVGAAIRATLDVSAWSEGSPEEELLVARATLAVFEVDDTGRKAAKAGGAAWTDALHDRARALRAALATLAGVPAAVTAVAGDTPTDAEDLGVSTFVLDAIEADLAARRADHHSAAARWPSLRAPHNVVPTELVKLRRPSEAMPELFVGPEGEARARDGFALTDRRRDGRAIEQEIDYCLLCHDRDKDSCSKGLREPKTHAIKKNALGVNLEGCPLEEKISEMHTMRGQGDALAALAIICIDNPMLPGTGHRICNDCMKGCVFQKQEPVNIPEVETTVLTDVLSLPWGFEIYGFLTRWNPLHKTRPTMRAYNGKNVLVVGLGPAGYTLAHHLSQEGFFVAAVDGLKIEPLPVELTGADGVPPRPIKDWKGLYEELDERILLGFGGVSEYGITVRWDKNFLSLLYVTLARSRNFQVHGGVRFGGAVTLEDAWTLGFDHVAIAAGAGRPTIIDLKNNLARGIRKASDFLMALQLSGAYKRSSLANLEVRLPALVIGGGLTAIDTATELIAYYPIQVEKTADRVAALIQAKGERAIVESFDEEERAFIAEQLGHAALVREERRAAEAEGRTPNFGPLIESWGGVSIVYRKRVIDSPAYRLNHEEVAKSLEEGVRYLENLSPEEAILDQHGAVKAMRFGRLTLDESGKWVSANASIELPARTVCVAAGTAPNVTYEREYPGTFAFDARKNYFQPHTARVTEDGAVVVERAERAKDGMFTSYADGKHTVSFYGDNHPHYAGSVVRAMASAKDGYPKVVELFRPHLATLGETPQAVRDEARRAISGHLTRELGAVVHEVNRLTPTIVEVIVKAPRAASKFEPGQFYRLQNFECFSAFAGPEGAESRLTMEGLALTGAWVDKEKGLLSLIALEMGTSSKMLANLKVGEPVVVMGPTGTPTEIPSNETVLLAGGGLGNAVLFSIAKALRARGATVLYFAGYKKGEDLFKQDEIEVATDQVVWCTDTGAEIAPRRPTDVHFRGNIVEAMIAYGKGELGAPITKLKAVHRIIAIGSDRMMNAVRDARHGALAPLLDPKHVAIASINSPMQCMMKEVCAQCLQRHVDPKTGKESFVFTCFNQDQDLDAVDFDNLRARLRQSSTQEKISNLYFEALK